MHAGNPERSARLRRTLGALRVSGLRGLTTAQLQTITRSCAVHSDVSELRQNGYLVSCNQEPMRAGRRVYRYTLKGKV
jgi:hypothetical protein